MTENSINHIVNVDQFAEKYQQKPILLLKYHYADFNEDIRRKYITIESSFETAKFEKFQIANKQWFQRTEYNTRWSQIFTAFTNEKRTEMEHFYQLLPSDAINDRENIIEIYYWRNGKLQLVNIPRELEVDIKIIKDTSLKLHWQVNEHCLKNIKQFEMSIETTDNDATNTRISVSPRHSHDPYEEMISRLQPSTKYQIKVEIITEFGKLPNTDKNVKIVTTNQRKAFDLFGFEDKQSEFYNETTSKIIIPTKRILNDAGSNSETIESATGKLQRFSIGPVDGQEKKVKTIMFVGRTGHGKTTMLSAMLNYLYEVCLNIK